MELRIFLRSSLHKFLIIPSLLLSACASDPTYTPTSTAVSTGNTTPIGLQNQAAAALIGGHVTFRGADYYSLFNPQPTTNCAGDANTYYDPLELSSGSPLVLASNLLDETTTIRPSFIKNISVDITNSNLFLPPNKAFSCSYGKSTLAPIPSNCAAFDNVNDTFVSVATTTGHRLLVGGAPNQNPYLLPSGNEIIRASALLEPYSVILPPAEYNLDKVVFVEKVDSSTNAVTIKTSGSDTIGDLITGASAITLHRGYLGYIATENDDATPPYYWAPRTFTSSSLTFASSPYVMPGLSYDQHLNVDTTNGNVVIPLPAASLSPGYFLLIRKTDTSTNTVTITPNGSDKIEDQFGTQFTSYSLTTREPEIVLLSVSYSNGIAPATYYWTTQNPPPVAGSEVGTVTAEYAINTGSPNVLGNQIVLVDALNSNLSLTLPAANSSPDKTIMVQRIDSSDNTVTLATLDSTPKVTDITLALPAVTLISTSMTGEPGSYFWKKINEIPYQASAGYNSGYYTTTNSACINSGPIVSNDPLVNSTLVGGVYFDIDRTQLGPNENLLLNITFFPLGQANLPLNQTTAFSILDTPSIKVHLAKIGQSGDTIRSITQPRILTYGSTTQYVQAAQDFSILGAPAGQLQQQQLYLPIAIDPGIDRIHVQRYSGNIIFIDATLFKTGYR